MFDSIRDHKKFLMGFLMILIIPSFVLFGIEGYTRFNEGGEAVASVDGEEITRGEWEQAHQRESQRLREMLPSLDAALLDSAEARYATLERLVRERVLAAAASDLNLFTSDQRLARELQQNESIAALRRADGSLDVEAYQQLLSRQGMSPEMFENSVRADLSQRQVLQGILGTGFAPTALAQVSLNAFFEQREVRVRSFSAAEYLDRVSPTDAELETFYNQNPTLFQAPEQADIEYLVLDAGALAAEIRLSEADLRSYYEQNAAGLSGNEERRASHILLTVEANAPEADKQAARQKAEELLAQVKADPSRFADLAKAHSQDPGSAANGGDLDYFGRGAMVAPFEEAVFALAKGAISDVVETDFGFHIIQLTDIKAPPQRSFEEVRGQIETQLKQQQAQQKFAEAADTFSNLVYEQADSLQPAAERLGLKVQSAKGVLRVPAAEQTGVLAHARLLEAIFSPDAISSKRNSEALDLGGSRLVSARVVEHRPAQTRPLAEVREQVRQRVIAQRTGALAREEGEKQLAAWRAGADAVGLGAAMTVSREAPQNFPQAVLEAALGADPSALPAWAGVSMGDEGFVVLRVEKIVPRAVTEPQRLQQEVQQVNQWWSSAESEAYLETLKTRYKARVLVDRPTSETTAQR